MIDGRTPKAGELEAFERLLESYGSDRTRWPAPQRLEFAGLIAMSRDAQRLYREAEALDRLLDLAPAPTSDKAHLVNRITMAAFGDGPEATSGRLSRQGISRTGSPLQGVVRRISWPTVSALAASLVVGVMAGFSGALDQTMGPGMAAVFEDGTSDADIGLLALDVATSPVSEEDLL